MQTIVETQCVSCRISSRGDPLFCWAAMVGWDNKGKGKGGGKGRAAQIINNDDSRDIFSQSVVSFRLDAAARAPAAGWSKRAASQPRQGILRRGGVEMR